LTRQYSSLVEWRCGTYALFSQAEHGNASRHLLWVTNIEMAEFLAATALVMLLSQCPDMGGLGRALMQVR
jgi:hypothetical protein